jgi:hypothetical protein
MLQSNMTRAFGAAAIALSVMATAAPAQQPGRIRGQIEKVDGNLWTVKTREGATLSMKSDDKTRVSALVKTSISEIKPDTFIGVAGIPRPDGSIEAFSIHVTSAPRGQGEGERPWDARPASTMTNTYFVSMVSKGDNQVLTVKNKDGEKKVIVTSATAIAAAAPADKSELKPGAQIIIFGWAKQPDGTILVKSMYVGRGLTPAM